MLEVVDTIGRTPSDELVIPYVSIIEFTNLVENIGKRKETLFNKYFVMDSLIDLSRKAFKAHTSAHIGRLLTQEDQTSWLLDSITSPLEEYNNSQISTPTNSAEYHSSTLALDTRGFLRKLFILSAETGILPKRSDILALIDACKNPGNPKNLKKLSQLVPSSSTSYREAAANWLITRIKESDRINGDSSENKKFMILRKIVDEEEQKYDIGLYNSEKKLRYFEAMQDKGLYEIYNTPEMNRRSAEVLNTKVAEISEFHPRISENLLLMSEVERLIKNSTLPISIGTIEAALLNTRNERLVLERGYIQDTNTSYIKLPGMTIYDTLLKDGRIIHVTIDNIGRRGKTNSIQVLRLRIHNSRRNQDSETFDENEVKPNNQWFL